jgi:hypothetical protein
VSGNRQKLKSKGGGEILISFFKDFAVGGKSMPLVLVFCVLM